MDPTTPVRQYARSAWTEQEGLPSALIWAIAQDHDGYLWLGTDAGLIRFDGIRFVHVDEPPLSTAPIRALLSTRDGSLWIGVNSAAVVARLRDGQFTRYTASDGLPVSVGTLLEDHNGVLWAGGRGGLSWFSDGRWQQLRGANFNDDAVTGLYEDHEHTLWVATSGRLYQRAANASAFAPVRSAFHVRALGQDSSGTMWAVGTQQAIGTVVDSPANRSLRAWRHTNGWRVLRDRQGSLWVASLGYGMLRLTNTASDRAPTVERFGTESGLTSDVVRSLFEDREGNIWIGTQHGLNRLSDSVIKTISSTQELSQPVRAVAPGREGTVWVGTDNGLYQFSGTERRHFDRRDGLPTAVIGALHTDRHGVLWAATDQGGLARLENGRFVAVSVPREARLRRVWAMTSDDEGALWLCEVDLGLFRWKAGTLTSFDRVPEVGRKFGVAALTDRAGRVWIGFSDGTLVVYDGGRFRAYTQKDGLPGGSVGAIYEDSRSTLWVGTAKGLGRLANGVFVAVSPDHGLPQTNVRAIVEDADHHIWIGVSAGIVRLDDDGKHYSLFDMFDGLRGVPIFAGGYPTAALGGDGSLWFVTSSGIALLNPRRLEKDRLPPPVRIEAIIADDKIFKLNQHLELPPLTSRIQIEYTGLSLTAPAKVHFRYMLEGFDREWIDGGTRRQAFYTNLPSGEYRFRVIADHDGVWNEAGATWEFSIRPTFYQTKWFYAVVLSALALVILAAWQRRVRQVHRRFSLVLAERARVAREIHDTVLQSLVGVAFQFDALSIDLDQSVPAGKKRLERLRTQIELAIREARQSIWDLRSSTLQSRDLPTGLREIGESFGGNAVRFEVSVKGTPGLCPRTLEEALLRIAREAVSNAVRHGCATQVHMELCYDPDAITLRVVDDGRGFESDTTPHIEEHWGLATMRERAEHIGGHMTLISHPGRGTEIEIVAPLGNAGLGR